MSNCIIQSAECKTIYSHLPIHFHKEHEILFIMEGVVEIIVNHTSIQASKGDIVFLSSFESHYTHIRKTPYKRYLLTISPSVFENKINDLSCIALFRNRSQLFSRMIHVGECQAIPSLIDRIIFELGQPCRDEYSEELLLMYLKEILIHSLRVIAPVRHYVGNETNIREIIMQIQRYLENQYPQDIKMAELCEQFHVSLAYLSRCFKQNAGLSPKQYLTNIRLNAAGEKIVNTNDTILSIALSVGFSDINNFTRKFKQHFQLTPLEFRKKYNTGVREPQSCDNPPNPE